MTTIDGLYIIDSCENKIAVSGDVQTEMRRLRTEGRRTVSFNKPPGKQKLIVRGSTCFKTDAMISDDRGTIRLELWENAIDQD